MFKNTTGFAFLSQSKLKTKRHLPESESDKKWENGRNKRVVVTQPHDQQDTEMMRERP